jgi:hypothetical protein
VSGQTASIATMVAWSSPLNQTDMTEGGHAMSSSRRLNLQIWRCRKPLRGVKSFVAKRGLLDLSFGRTYARFERGRAFPGQGKLKERGGYHAAWFSHKRFGVMKGKLITAAGSALNSPQPSGKWLEWIRGRGSGLDRECKTTPRFWEPLKCVHKRRWPRVRGTQPRPQEWPGEMSARS